MSMEMKAYTRKQLHDMLHVTAREKGYGGGTRKLYRLSENMLRFELGVMLHFLMQKSPYNGIHVTNPRFGITKCNIIELGGFQTSTCSQRLTYKSLGEMANYQVSSQNDESATQDEAGSSNSASSPVASSLSPTPSPQERIWRGGREPMRRFLGREAAGYLRKRKAEGSEESSSDSVSSTD